MTIETETCRDCGIETEPKYLTDGLCPECNAYASKLNEEAWRDV